MSDIATLADSVPFNNSPYCLCEMSYAWVGPQCMGISPTTLLVAASFILLGIIAFVLGFITMYDAFTLAKVMHQDQRGRRPTVVKFGSILSAKSCAQHKDVQVFTCFLLSATLLGFGCAAVVDVTGVLARKSCPVWGYPFLRMPCYSTAVLADAR